MGKSITFIDRDSMGNTISRVHDNTSGTARGIEGEDSLDGNIHGGLVEGVVPDLLHVIPVGNDSVLNGVLKGEDTSLGLSLISNIGILLSHTDHHTLVAGTSNNGGEDGSGSVISSKSSLAHAGAIVNNKSSNVFVTHLI